MRTDTLCCIFLKAVPWINYDTSIPSHQRQCCLQKNEGNPAVWGRDDQTVREKGRGHQRRPSPTYTRAPGLRRQGGTLKGCVNKWKKNGLSGCFVNWVTGSCVGHVKFCPGQWERERITAASMASLHEWVWPAPYVPISLDPTETLLPSGWPYWLNG